MSIVFYELTEHFLYPFFHREVCLFWEMEISFFPFHCKSNNTEYKKPAGSEMSKEGNKANKANHCCQFVFIYVCM